MNGYVGDEVGDGWVWLRIVFVIYDLAILLAQYLVWC